LLWYTINHGEIKIPINFPPTFFLHILVNSFKYVGFIIIFINQMFMRSVIKMDTIYYCPACKSKNVIEYEEMIECPSCNLEFFKEGLGEIADENKLSVQELNGIAKAFDDLEDEKTRKKFVESLEKDKI